MIFFIWVILLYSLRRTMKQQIIIFLHPVLGSVVLIVNFRLMFHMLSSHKIRKKLTEQKKAGTKTGLKSFFSRGKLHSFIFNIKIKLSLHFCKKSYHFLCVFRLWVNDTTQWTIFTRDKSHFCTSVHASGDFHYL